MGAPQQQAPSQGEDYAGSTLQPSSSVAIPPIKQNFSAKPPHYANSIISSKVRARQSDLGLYSYPGGGGEPKMPNRDPNVTSGQQSMTPITKNQVLLPANAHR